MRNIAVFVVAVVIGFAGSAYSQKTEEPTELEQLRIQVAILTSQLNSCQTKLGINNSTNVLQDVQRSVEAAHPGWTINWATGKLVQKAKPK
jgi:hypothetical protein